MRLEAHLVFSNVLGVPVPPCAGKRKSRRRTPKKTRHICRAFHLYETVSEVVDLKPTNAGLSNWSRFTQSCPRRGGPTLGWRTKSLWDSNTQATKVSPCTK